MARAAGGARGAGREGASTEWTLLEPAPAAPAQAPHRDPRSARCAAPMHGGAATQRAAKGA
jgi:hypothetical protein